MMEYIETYGDGARAEAWRAQAITEANCPPVRFTIDGKRSDTLRWEKTVSPQTVVTDYPDTAPAERTVETVTFVCEEYPVAVVLEVTSYPGFPVVEYEATLRNLSEETTPEIRDLLAVDGVVYAGAGDTTVWYYTGSSPDGNSDYNEKTAFFDAAKGGADNELTFRATNGKPTSQYLPDLNVETAGGGVIAVLSWQGNWQSKVSLDGEGIRWAAGQEYTDFQLLGKETHRLPAVVLIYYRGSRLYGQNIYRRWFFKHNFMRASGRKLGTAILVAATGCLLDEPLIDMQSNAKADTIALQNAAAHGFADVADRFVQDAGWNEYRGAPVWYATMGNWVEDAERYPNGLKEISALAASAGLGYSLWVEPERVKADSDFAKAHPDCVLFRRDECVPKWRHEDFPSTVTSMDGLVNLGNPKACDLVIDMVDGILKRAGADSYRQDFNMYPARHWETNDAYESGLLGIKRDGRTEERHLNGYLRLFDTLIERHPGLIIDACASGGMRYDLATARRSFCHTRTDFFENVEKAQSDTYVNSLWMGYFGSFLETASDYVTRSRIAGDVGVCIKAGKDDFDYGAFYGALLPCAAQWRELSSYMSEDYYPLTPYLNMTETGVLAMEYDCPSQERGMVVCYIRGEGHEGTLKLYGLDAEATYRIRDYDEADSERTVSGRELMENGIRYEPLTQENTATRNESGIPAAAKVYLYEKAGGR